MIKNDIYLSNKDNWFIFVWLFASLAIIFANSMSLPVPTWSIGLSYSFIVMLLFVFACLVGLFVFAYINLFPSYNIRRITPLHLKKSSFYRVFYENTSKSHLSAHVGLVSTMLIMFNANIIVLGVVVGLLYLGYMVFIRLLKYRIDQILSEES